MSTTPPRTRVRPRHFTRPDWRKARFLIDCPAMSDAGLWTFEADGVWHIIHGTPGAGLVPFRCDGTIAAMLDEVVFIADCVSFDHDMPTVVRPSATTAASKKRSPIAPLVPSPERLENAHAYFDAVSGALGTIAAIRFGDASLRLRYGEYPALTRFNSRLGRLRLPLGLYAMATRQVEILGEYLCLYRILEWADGTNGMTFIRNRVGALATHNFGKLMSDSWPHRRTMRADVFGILRRRALRRIHWMQTQGWGANEIASYLYGLRNGLAHGSPGRARLRLDSAVDVAEIAKDLPIVKLLARMAIE